MKTPRLYSLLSLLAVASLLLSACNTLPFLKPQSTEPAAPTSGAYEKADCPFDVPAGVKVECGYLTVPENRAKPQGDTIRLAVAIFKSSSSTPEPDPIVYLEGGPGGSPLRAYPRIFSLIFDPFLTKRDLIMIDQRGTGYSQPALDCPEYNQTAIEMLSQDLEVKDAEAKANAALETCRARLVSEGVDLAGFTSAANAADVEDLRKALGYEKWNLYGISYGTRLALTIMRDFPQGLRSVVIDSVYPPQVSLETGTPANAARAFDALFTACADDSACSEVYPNLSQVFTDAVEALNAKPVTTPMTLSSGETIDWVVDGDTVVSVLFQSMYATSLLPLLPSLIWEVKDGNFEALAGLESQFLDSNKDISLGMNLAVQCYEEIPFSTQEEIVQAVQAYPELGGAFAASEGDLQVCRAWQPDPAPALENQPVTSSVPTLLLAGEFDPITPPEWAKEAAATLSDSHFFVVPGAGHGSSLTEACPRSMALAFWNDPSKTPDGSCLEQDMQFAFSLPTTEANVTMTPYENKAYGYRTVMPQGWRELYPGAMTPTGSATDPTQLAVQAAPMARAQLLKLIGDQLKQSGVMLPESPNETLTASGMSWDVYNMSAGLTKIDLAAAEQDGKTYMVLLQAQSTERDALYEAVLLAIVNNFEPLK